MHIFNRTTRRLTARGIIPAGIGLRSDDGHPSGGGATGAGDGGDNAGDQGAQATNDDGQHQDGGQKAPEIDWKAEARKHEKRAKENAKAAEELAKLKASQMSEQEKAVAAAKAEGMTEATKAAGVKLAAAELKAEAAAKGVDLSAISKYLKADLFVGEDGEVDSKAVKAAVADFAKLAPKPTGSSGGDFGGAPDQQPASLAAQIRAAESKGDWATARQLKTQQMFNH